MESIPDAIATAIRKVALFPADAFVFVASPLASSDAPP